MRFLSTLVTTLASASVASAAIAGFTVPKVIVAGEPFTLTLVSQNISNQANLDVAVAWGFSNGTGFLGTLGRHYNSTGLGWPLSNRGGNNIDLNVTAPEQLDGFEYTPGANLTLTIGVYSIYGVSGGYNLVTWNNTVTVGDEVSSETVTSFSSHNAVGFSSCK
ncbi:hypothetical protein ACJQWK_08799 [Exserohilum turcicum]|uniref:Uncharacterized protein n=1 Tax=Exserohilum turcicum (strain 28A) TaxID=671987 RepID=R0ING9_EXST2|nr:uncharacterized protein SETTUDRAFT_162785 [Exserohilum turcica Et28A]EOA86520.1 hypothetical protein SETTUDRAFT_162785 [Exserohilum turcica Et28A]